MAGGGQRMARRADDEAAHQPGIAEAHLGLGGMDVDVHLLRRQLEEQRHHGMAVAGEEILIGAAHRALQQAVAHRPAVDEEELLGRGRLVEGRQADIAGEPCPSRSASMGSAFSANSRPITAARRSSRAVSASAISPGVAA